MMKSLWESLRSLFNKELKESVVLEATQLKPEVTKISPIFRRSNDKIYVQVGIDFGTSATKIAFRQQGKITNVRALFFDHGLKSYPNYCLPSVVAFDGSSFLMGDKAAQYLQSRPWDDGLKYLKVIVAGRNNNSFKDEKLSQNYETYMHKSGASRFDVAPEDITAMFLAYTIRLAKNQIKRILKEENIDFTFNICVPIDHKQNNATHSAFKKIFGVAENVEQLWRDTTSNHELLNHIKQCSNFVVGAETRVFLIPESVAQVASYLDSLQAKSGLHTIIDFGAGTTDLSIFNLTDAKEADATAWWYAARNIPRGSYRIDRIISDYLNASENIKAVSGLEVDQARNNMSYSLQVEIRNELNGLWDDSLEVWRKAYGKRKKQSEWEKSKVQVFVCGGASKNPLVNGIFRRSWMDGWGPYPIQILPTPSDYGMDHKKAPFERLAVAYGLTIPEPTLKKYVLPDDVPDQTPASLPRRVLPDRDDLYPK